MSPVLVFLNVVHVMSVVLCSRETRTDRTEVIKSAEGPYGITSDWIYCNEGVFATGFAMKFEEESFFSKIKKKIGVKDEVGALSFEMICGDGELLKASNAKTGGKRFEAKCTKSDSNIIGFQTKVDHKDKASDNSGVNALRAYCADDTSTVINEKGKGAWGNKAECARDSNAKVCGFRQKVDSAHTIGEDTALNVVQFACCGNRDALGGKIWEKPKEFVHQRQVVHLQDVVIENEEAPTFDIHLSDGASVYLKPICAWFKEKYGLKTLDKAYKDMMKKIPSFAQKMFVKYAKKYLEKPDEYIGEPYLSEMRYYVECAGKELEYTMVDAVKLNLLYEFAYIACTSIVCMDKHGHILHGRNFDFPPLLRNYSIHLKYYENHENKQVLYESIGLFAFVGTATAVKQNAYGISMNLRRAWDIWNNLINLERLKLPSSWIIRECLIHDSTYEDCQTRIMQTYILAPAYYIMSGLDNTDRGCVIARRPMPHRWGEQVQNVRKLGTLGDVDGGWFIAETNFDDWHESGTVKNIIKTVGWASSKVGKVLLKDDRLEEVKRLMREVGPHRIDIDTLYTLMSTPPVLAGNTVFTSIFSPSFKIMNYVNVTIRKDAKRVKLYEEEEDVGVKVSSAKSVVVNEARLSPHGNMIVDVSESWIIIGSMVVALGTYTSCCYLFGIKYALQWQEIKLI